MFLSKQLTTIFLAQTLCLLASVSGNSVGTKSMHFVANVDGKSFYAERLPDRSWDEAAKACSDFGMRLASVDTVQQAEAISKYVPPEGYFDHWTSARDAHTLRQFSWHNTGAQLASDLHFVLNNIDYQTCLSYNFRDGALHTYRCSERLGTLRETVTID